MAKGGALTGAGIRALKDRLFQGEGRLRGL